MIDYGKLLLRESVVNGHALNVVFIVRSLPLTLKFGNIYFSV